MAGNGHSFRGYSTYNTPQAEDWRRTSYASDRAYRPVIIDAEERKREIISCTPTENPEAYVIKAETLVQQQVHSSMSPNYKYGARPAHGRVEDYVVVVDQYGRGKRWHQPNDRPEKVEEFPNKVQTEASRPRIAPVNAPHWRTPTGNTGGYGNDQTSKEWKTPIGNPYRYEKSQNYPAMVTGGESTRPSQSSWATPPDASLSKPTSDINTAVTYLHDAARTSAAPKPRSFEQAYPETIDSKEAARRYGNYNFGPRPYAAEDNCTTTIDSREAARKYRGTTV